MRVVKLLAIIFVFFYFAGAQTTAEKFKFVGRFYFEDSDERILSHELTEEGKLSLVGANYFQVWDIKTNKIVEKKRHGIKNLLQSGASNVFSQNTRRAVVLSRELKEYDSLGKKIKRYSPAELWDAASGEKIAVFDNISEPVKSVLWSDDGKILVTASDENFGKSGGYRFTEGGELLGNEVGETQIVFRDGISGERRAVISVSNLTWRYLSADGAQLLTTSGPKKEVIGIDYASQKAATIDVWNTANGKLEKSFVIGDDVYFSRTRKLQVSPDGKHLALVQKSRKSDADDRLLIFRLDGDALPEFVIKASPQIADSDLTYTPDGKFVAVDSGKNTQIYSLETGAKKGEIINFDPPYFWLGENSIALYGSGDKITGIRTSNGEQIFQQTVVYKTTEVGKGSYTTDSNGNQKEDTETVVVDFTTIAARPEDTLFLEYSHKYATVCDARNGAIVQKLVEPAQIVKRKRKILGVTIGTYLDDGKNTVSQGEWSSDGKYVLIRDYEGVSISIWELKN